MWWLLLLLLLFISYIVVVVVVVVVVGGCITCSNWLWVTRCKNRVASQWPLVTGPEDRWAV